MEKDLNNLVAALRCKRDDCEGCDLAFFDKDEGWMCQYSAKDDDSAAAIEALQAQLPKRGEIVRCGECKWYQPDLCANPWGVCFHEDWVANNIGHTVDEDGFCYRGERKVQE